MRNAKAIFYYLSSSQLQEIIFHLYISIKRCIGVNFYVPITVFFLLIVSQSCTPPVPERPNVILILADDLGWSDPGFMGNTYHETPNLDRLAKRGMIFRQAYANAPNCAPTRASIMSGQYTPRHGIFTVGSPERGKTENRKLVPIPNRTTLDTKIYTLPEALKTAGYVNAHIGKWHLGEHSSTNPTAQGFDVNIGGNLSGSPASYFSPYKNPQLEDGPEGEHLTERLSKEAKNFIIDHHDRPFFLNLWYHAVHTPIQSKDSLIEKYTQKAKRGVDQERYDPTYAAMIEIMDNGIGELIATLDSLGLEEHTLIFFLSDNGPFFPVSSAAPLRGSKGMLYEGGIRVPMIACWPGKIPKQSTCEEPVIASDLYPTILSAASVASSPTHILDGINLFPFISQQTDTLPSRTLYWHFPAYLQAYRGMDQVWRQTPASAILHDGWKLIETFEDSTLEMYQLNDDLKESKNLVDEQPDKAQELYKNLNNWRKLINAPVPTQRNEAYVPEDSP